MYDYFKVYFNLLFKISSGFRTLGVRTTEKNSEKDDFAFSSRKLLYIIYEIRMNLNDVRSWSKVNMKSVLES